jgi:hypothetical protein
VTKQRAREVLAERREITARREAAGIHVHRWAALATERNRYQCACGAIAHRVGMSQFRVHKRRAA